MDHILSYRTVIYICLTPNNNHKMTILTEQMWEMCTQEKEHYFSISCIFGGQLEGKQSIKFKTSP